MVFTKRDTELDEDKLVETIKNCCREVCKYVMKSTSLTKLLTEGFLFKVEAKGEVDKFSILECLEEDFKTYGMESLNSVNFVTQSSNRWLIDDGENKYVVIYDGKYLNVYDQKRFRLFEYLGSIKHRQIRGARGIFRQSGVLKESTKEFVQRKKNEREILQEVLQGEEKWGIDKPCPNCGSEGVEFCYICYVLYLKGLERVKNKINPKK